MGCGRSTATEAKKVNVNKQNINKAANDVQKQQVDQDQSKRKKLQDDDNWWKQIQEEYKREKEHNKVNMNRGWANPFGNQPTLSKDILLGK